MSEQTKVEPAVGDVPTMARSPGWLVVRRRGTELLIVFFGVYAAFLLNRMDTDRRDAKRRAQILDALEREMGGEMGSFKENVAQAGAQFAEFERQLAHGDMPQLAIVYTNSSYSATDDATLLQAGGLELLDMETVSLLKKVNNLQRTLLEATHNQFELSLAMLPNHDPEYFYDPATHQLKPQYRWYPYILRQTLSNANDAVAAEDELLAHLRAIRHPAANSSPVPSPAGRTTPSRSPAASSPGA